MASGRVQSFRCRYATQDLFRSSVPWAEAHGYLRCVAPRHWEFRPSLKFDPGLAFGSLQLRAAERGFMVAVDFQFTEKMQQKRSASRSDT